MDPKINIFYSSEKKESKISSHLLCEVTKGTFIENSNLFNQIVYKNLLIIKEF